ncbi:UNVERIFIED_CONTAM: hypothetical protein Sradi_2024300 [Sesamum radiatum]|uniref:Uncharacterized protein n=1 Tax=Sesamum radiatum TaxID=300843 RepID=A0AAW2TGC3_SESRA
MVVTMVGLKCNVDNENEHRVSENEDSDSLLDSNYNMDETNADFVNDEIQLANVEQNVGVDGDVSAEDSGERDVVDSKYDLDENKLSDGQGGRSIVPVFNPVEIFDLTFKLAMIFSSKTELEKQFNHMIF